MDQKIIFFDIDGTILSNRNYKISESTIEAIRQAKANGHLTFINTGRTFSEIDDMIKEVGFDGYVCGCGTYISYDSSVLLHSTIDSDICQRVIADFNKYDMNAVLEGHSAIYFNKNIKHPKLQRLQNMYHNLNFNVGFWDDSDIVFDKFCIWFDSLDNIQDLQIKYDDLFEFIYRGELFVEVVPKGYSKATGIQFLLSHLNISHENAYALGDSANDLSMLSYVKHSIGMGNSEELIKKTVSYLTKDVDEDGVAHALKHFNII